MVPVLNSHILTSGLYYSVGQKSQTQVKTYKEEQQQQQQQKEKQECNNATAMFVKTTESKADGVRRQGPPRDRYKERR